MPSTSPKKGAASKTIFPLTASSATIGAVATIEGENDWSIERWRALPSGALKNVFGHVMTTRLPLRVKRMSLVCANIASPHTIAQPPSPLEGAALWM